ncbi:ABC transporter permease [Winogradskyella alexanderae]|uniref:ABC transporter permease n=1 Tax=Winogradskyella alexanderae TaxID=2877123 RepID=A0ABS7XTP5_9FLAO|nr:FtsX-like permease family protein [Winogradskyella alexanderae]MCA0133392.1 ABC transporter permease [Winogradskyella alexanderae]
MVNWKLILSIAKTHLLTKVKQTSIAALGVTFGIGAYITLVCFMTGLNTMLDNLILNQTPHIHIYNEIKPSKTQPIDLYDELQNSLNIVHSVKPKITQKKIHNALPIMDYLTNNENVMAVLPQIETQIFYIAGSIEIGGNITGIDPIAEATHFNLNNNIIEGSAEDLNVTDNSIILGVGIADRMSLKVGDRVQLSPLDGGLFPLKIVGIFQSGIADIDAIQSFTNIKTIQQILGKPKNYITDINVKLTDIKNAPEMAKQIEKQFDLRAIDIQTANAQFETGTTIRNLITYAVSITLLIVAGFGIYNILNMLIYEKMNDIAILKATGFSGRDVKLIFMSQAMIIGFLGGVLGLLIGLGLTSFIGTLPFNTEALPTIETYPINLNPLFFVIGFSFAMISTFLAGYLPSKRAEKIDPVKIIRGQ